MSGNKPGKNSNSLVVTTPSDCGIAMTRIFNAPRELVFDAWVDPKQVAQ